MAKSFKRRNPDGVAMKNGISVGPAVIAAVIATPAARKSGVFTSLRVLSRGISSDNKASLKSG